jgi:hypothetical protein
MLVINPVIVNIWRPLPFTFKSAVANFKLGKKGETMKPNLSLLRTTGLYFALFLAVWLNPIATVAEESEKSDRDNVAASHLLDGKKFIGPTGEKGKKVHHEDVLTFSDGKFTSSECFQYGFKGSPYTATLEADSILFHAVTTSPTHGKMVWDGTLKGDTLDVTYSWTKERWFWTTFREYWFKGSLAK